MNQISNCHGLITRAFESVSQSQTDLIQSLGSACNIAMHEIATSDEQWISKVRSLIESDGSETYIGYSKSHNTIAELFETDCEVTILSDFQPTAETVIRLVESGCHSVDGYQQILNTINLLVLKSLNSYRKLLYKNNFDPDFLEDRVQEAALEIIRAARCYRNDGVAAFDTYASARVKTAINRKEMKHHLMLKVSDRDISNAYAQAVEINAGKVSGEMAKASDFLPRRLHGNQYNEEHCQKNGIKPQNNSELGSVMSTRTQNKLNSFLALKLKSLSDNERLVLFNEVGLVGEPVAREQIVAHLGVSSARYTQLKTSALQKLGMFKQVSPTWQRALA
ncbi:hypothetical protein J4N45_11130 [Vibrio sp. SCSIO 43140]|uniref:hypothetical protein n=1 Tax=Vibrio sp. SCSIO 43140 TaxID=2819100 RepID=UPI002075F0F4|nr:hypothetical protein [Vibrio sp. SCSIO 43140]USD59084.1 hypothetical protein J4N45_11130 [Vibrio sp. SCSIO 43140]